MPVKIPSCPLCHAETFLYKDYLYACTSCKCIGGNYRGLMEKYDLDQKVLCPRCTKFLLVKVVLPLEKYALFYCRTCAFTSLSRKPTMQETLFLCPHCQKQTFYRTDRLYECSNCNSIGWQYLHLAEESKDEYLTACPKCDMSSFRKVFYPIEGSEKKLPLHLLFCTNCSFTVIKEE